MASCPASVMMTTRLLKDTVLELPPSCMQFVPSRPEYLVVGTYDLKVDEAESVNPESRRSGSLILFQWLKDQL